MHFAIIFVESSHQVFVCRYDAFLCKMLRVNAHVVPQTFKNGSRPTHVSPADCCFTRHTSLCWFTCQPLINKWGLAREVEMLSWPICDRSRGLEDEPWRGGGASWGTTACLSYSPNLAFVKSGRVRTCAHMDTHTQIHTHTAHSKPSAAD